ncbi:hypothetical protein C8Q72DRAFT_254874 [Fomitopsis betulina]|nr:hypothetical protein C8Q72DRAFT_254874 [Fomitopsis betulina]
MRLPLFVLTVYYLSVLYIFSSRLVFTPPLRCDAVSSFSFLLQSVDSLTCGRVARSCLPPASCAVLPYWVDELLCCGW